MTLEATTQRYFKEHASEFHDHPPTMEWPCPTPDCGGKMQFDLGLEGCMCSKCERYDGVK